MTTIHIIAAGLAALLWLGGGAAAFAASAPGATGARDQPAAGPDELQTLVAPVALYPDHLLAIVLKAAAHPRQIEEAARYLDALEDVPSLPPDEGWHEAVVALLNYPQVVTRLSEDTGWTRELGRAVVEQEEAVLRAVERFRRDTHAAGNLVSDQRQRVEVNDRALEIHPANPAVLYVPRYEPSLVRLRRATGAFGYYPRPCPVYYYAYPAGHSLMSRRFWGVTSVFSIGWRAGQVRWHPLEHRSRRDFGHSYGFRHYRYLRSAVPEASHYRRLPEARRDPRARWRHDRHLRSTRPDRLTPGQAGGRSGDRARHYPR